LHSEKPLKRLKAGVRPPHRAEAAVLMRELDDLDAFALIFAVFPLVGPTAFMPIPYKFGDGV
jgi:hypothetical protein